jgi:3-polyprenyl-4-hydroxybenzoate decarboxylase
MIDHTIGRALELFDIDTGTVRRWDPSRAEKHPSRK